jgi:hypothetical protein
VAPPLWTPEAPLPPPGTGVRAWDGSRVAPGLAEPLSEALPVLRARLRAGAAVFVAHRRALPQTLPVDALTGAHVWVPGIETWQALAARGVWVEGCADGLGVGSLEPLVQQPLLQLPAWPAWTLLTHAEATWNDNGAQVLATYAHRALAGAPSDGPAADVTHVYWHSGAQFDRWRTSVGPQVQHACGIGRTAEHLRRAGVQNLRLFPQVALWRQWLGL